MASQPTLTPSWKQELHRRVAEHQSRRLLSVAERKAPPEAGRVTTSRAALAARVAARYAKAPSYSQMQAAEARTAVRAAEIATEVAIKAQAAARAVIAGLESARDDESKRNADVFAGAPFEPEPPAPATRRLPLEFHLEPEMPMRRGRARSARHTRQQDEMETFPSLPEEWRQADESANDPLGSQKLDQLEAALPELAFHANLIEFPHEQTPAQQVRPPIHGGSQLGRTDAEPKLSIFEVDPRLVTLDDAPEASAGLPVVSQWSGIELDVSPQDILKPEPAAPTEAAGIELAAFSRRLMAAVVDGALITGALLVAALVAATNMQIEPSASAKLLMVGSAAALFLTGLLYQALFFTLSDATPGMKYARVSLCTFDDQCPTRGQLLGRLGAMLLSLLPLGLGLVWAIFDEDHLSWHDRLSRTYQRRSDLPITIR